MSYKLLALESTSSSSLSYSLSDCFTLNLYWTWRHTHSHTPTPIPMLRQTCSNEHIVPELLPLSRALALIDALTQQSSSTTGCQKSPAAFLPPPYSQSSTCFAITLTHSAGPPGPWAVPVVTYIALNIPSKLLVTHVLRIQYGDEGSPCLKGKKWTRLTLNGNRYWAMARLCNEFRMTMSAT